MRPSTRRLVSSASLAPLALAAVLLGGCGGDDPAAAEPVDEAVAADVAMAAERSWSVLNEARLDPTDADKRRAAVDAFTGKAKEAVTELLSQYGVTGQVSRTDESAPAVRVPDAGTVTLSSDGQEATVEVCEVDSNILVQPGMAADGGDVIVESEGATVHLKLTLRLVDGVWLEADGEILDREPGATTCDD